jgi:peptidoglycan/xylan/chitin deacetylase (PgdA/CDA1 family)
MTPSASVAAVVVEFPPHQVGQQEALSGLTGFGGPQFDRFGAGAGVQTPPHRFFVVANRVDGDAAARALLTRMVRDCHQVGDHSLTHGRPLGELPEQGTIAEIATAHDILRQFTGEKFLFRPWGTEGQLDRQCLNRAAVSYLVSGKHTCVLWNSVPRDWADPAGWIDRALSDARRGNTQWW